MTNSDRMGLKNGDFWHESHPFRHIGFSKVLGSKKEGNRPAVSELKG
jgi:hypothetical protein